MIYLNHNPHLHKVTVHYKSQTHDGMYTSNGIVVFPPAECDYLVLGFGFHSLGSSGMNTKLVESILNENIGIVYVCNHIPENSIIHKNLIYLNTGRRWFTHLCIKNPEPFKAVFSNNVILAKENARCFSTHYGFNIPIIKTLKDLPVLGKINYNISHEKICLIESYDGLGDVLMTLPSAETLHNQGWKVRFLTDRNKTPLFDNLSYIDKVYSQQDTIPMQYIARSISLSAKLSTYNLDWNQQHRIYSSAYLCSLRKEELITLKPNLVLTKKEKAWAKTKLKNYEKTVGICWYAVGSNRSYFKDYTQQLCDHLNKKGFTPIIIGKEKFPFKDCIDFSGDTTIRQLLALVNEFDYIITVDTGILHIAGAFDKPTVAIMGPIQAEWRCSTYKNCYPIIPKVRCYPCADGQWVPREKRMCSTIESHCLRTITPVKILKHFLKVSKKHNVR